MHPCYEKLCSVIYEKLCSVIYRLQGDIATVESSIIICNNGKIVFSSGIVLDENAQGLQSRDFGWIEASQPNMLVNQCRQFKRIYSPIIILR